MMNLRKFRTVFMLSSILLMFVVLGFTGLLNITSFKQNYTDSLISSYTVLGGETVRKIEYAVKYGKPLDNFYEMGEMLSEIPRRSPQIERVEVLLPDKMSYYDQHGPLSKPIALPSTLAKASDFSGNLDVPYRSEVHEGQYHIFLPIHDRAGNWAGTMRIVFDQAVVGSVVDEYMWKQIGYLVLFFVGAALLLFVFFSRFSFLTESGQIRQRRLLVFICVILGLIQAIFGWMNYTMLRNGYLETVKENTSTVLTVVQEDIEYVVEMGVPYNRMHGVGEYMARMIESLPEIDRISVINDDFTTEIVAGQEIFATEYTYSVPLPPDGEHSARYIAVVDLSRDHMAAKTRGILLDTMTMVVVSFLLMVEVTLFQLFFLKKQLAKQEHAVAEGPAVAPGGVPLRDREPAHAGESAHDGAPVHAGDPAASPGLQPAFVSKVDRSIVRPIGFIVFGAVYISSAFVPVLMKQLYQPLFGLPENIVLGLPISVEMFCLAVSSILAGYWIDRKGWRPSLFTGLVLLAAGSLMSAIAWDAVSFILARGLVGVGFGLSLISMQNYVILGDDEDAKNQAITALNSGAYAGINCGVVIGAMLGDRIGFSEVFYVAVAIVILGILFVSRFMPAETIASDRSGHLDVSPGDDARLSPALLLKNFFLDRQILVFFMMVIVPVAICGMFLYYFFPLYAESVGTSSSDIGRAFLLNGLAIVFLGPLLSKYAEKYLGSKYSIFVSGLFVVIALAVFAMKGSMWAAFLAVILLGVSEGFGVTSQINYFIQRKATQDLGEGKSLGYYSLVENLGQMAGPIVFGAMAVIGLTQGVGVISVGLLITLILFLMLSGSRGKMSFGHGVGGDAK